jgi:hypothetical protein
MINNIIFKIIMIEINERIKFFFFI